MSGQQLLDIFILVPFCAAMEEPPLSPYLPYGCCAGFSVSSLVQFNLNGARGVSDTLKPGE